MTLWFLFALMTAAASFAILWPLGRRPALVNVDAGLAVYREQFKELERDRRAGLIDAADAEAARVEIGRRLIAAAAAPRTDALDVSAPQSRPRAVAIAALTLVPAAALALYAALGSPDLPDAPLTMRTQAPLLERPIETLVTQVEAHLAANPDDRRGWEVLAPVYLQLGRFSDAVTARRNALRLNEATARREADLGEALVYAANGVVTAEARTAFERALVHDREDIKARYFLGLAAEQDGKAVEAATIWRALLAGAPADAPWAEAVRRALARLQSAGAEETSPTIEDIAAAEALTPDQRQSMVRGMVDRLAARLKEDGSSIEDWLRLVRAYMVLGERENAKTAAADARRAAGGDQAKIRRLDELMRTLGLET